MATSAPAKTSAEKADPAKVTGRVAGTGTLIDKLWALREQKRALEAQADAISKEMSVYEEQLAAKMDADGVTKATGRAASVSFSFSVAANVGVEGDVDAGWDALHAFIKKTGYWHLLHRRVSDAAYKELLDSGKKVPGCTPFTKKRINLRALAQGTS